MARIAKCSTSYYARNAMHDDIEYRVTLARAMREAGVGFDVIAETLRQRTRFAKKQERLQSSAKQVRNHREAHFRQEVAAGMRREKAHFGQIGAALNVSYTGARNLVRRAEKRAAMPSWLNGLDMRTANVLLRAGFQNTEELRNAIASGRAIERIKAPRMTMIQAWLQVAQ